MKVGDKVVCVDSIGWPTLILDEIYRVDGITSCSRCGMMCIQIFSVPYPNLQYPLAGRLAMCRCGLVTQWNHELAARRFRPIVQIGDSVEEYILSKIQEPVTV